MSPFHRCRPFDPRQHRWAWLIPLFLLCLQTAHPVHVVKHRPPKPVPPAFLGPGYKGKANPDGTVTFRRRRGAGYLRRLHRIAVWLRPVLRMGLVLTVLPIMSAVITAAAGGGNWTAGGTWVGGVAPTAADDAKLDATSGNVTIDAATAVCRSLDCTGYTGTLTQAAGNFVTVGDSVAGAGNIALKLVAGMTYTPSGLGLEWNFVSTSATVQTVDFAGKTTSSVTFGGASGTPSYKLTGSWLQGATSTTTLSRGTLDLNGQSLIWGTFSASTTNAKTLTPGAAAITITGVNVTAWSVGTTSNLTVTANTATVNFTSTGGVNIGLGVNHNGMSMTCREAVTFANGAGTIGNLTYTSSTNARVQFAVDLTVTGTLSSTGGTGANRAFFQSNTLGTPRTVTAATVSLTNTDFQDIIGAGAASPFTGTSIGDALGNSGITFTPAATQTRSGAGGNWSTAGNWTSRVPLPQDNVIIDSGASGTITADMPRLGKDITCTGFAGTLTWTISVQMYGSWMSGAGMVLTSNSAQLSFAGRGNHSITSNGISFGDHVCGLSGPGSTYTLGSALTATGNWSLNDGTFDTASFAVTVANFDLRNTTRTRAITMGSTVFTITGTGNCWNALSASNLTVTAGTSIIDLTNVTGGGYTFAGGGKTYATVRANVATVPTTLTVTGSNTFDRLIVGANRQLVLPASTTQTILSYTTCDVAGRNNGYLYLPGVSGNYASAPDSAALSITGDITIDCKVALDTWVPAANADLVAKWTTAGNQKSYILRIDTAGKVVLFLSNDGSAAVSGTSSVATGLANGAVKWIRASWVDSTNTVQFFMSDDGSAWTQLGTNVALASAGVFDSTAVLEIGSQDVGTSSTPAGKFYVARIYNSALGSGSGTAVFDANFTTKAFGVNSFTESSANAATVTINGTQAKAGDGRVSLESSTPGTAATISKSSGRVIVNHVVLQDSTATGGATFDAANSVNVSGNTGWGFSPAGIAADGGGNWSSTATWTNGVVPTAATDVAFTNTSGNVTIDAASSCRSIDCIAYVGTLTHNASSALSIGDATAGANGIALRFSTAMTYTSNLSASTTAFQFIATATTVQTINFAGKQTRQLVFGGGSGNPSYQLAGSHTAIDSAETITHQRGTLDLNGQVITWGAYTSSNSATRSLVGNGANVTINGGGVTVWNLGTSTSMTVSSMSTTTIAFTGAGVTASMGPFAWGTVVFSGSGVPLLTSGAAGLSFVNLTRTGTAAKTDGLSINTNITVTSTLTLTANSLINALIVQNNSVGAARVVTVNGSVALSGRVDFMDITGAGTASWDFSSLGAGNAAGDALGNSGITFTAATTQTHTASAGGNWSDVTKWTSRVPLPQDNVVIDSSTTGTLTADMPRLGKDITCTGFAGTLATNSVSHSYYGSLTLSAGMTLTSSASFTTTCAARSSVTLTSSGKTLGSFVFNGPGGTLTLSDAAATGLSGGFNITAGTLVTSGFSISSGTATHGTATLALGATLWTLYRQAGVTVWTAVAGTTINAGTSIIDITGTDAGGKTFAGGGKTYNTVRANVATVPTSLAITGANTFSRLVVGPNRQLIFPASTTQTITNYQSGDIAGQNNGYLYLPGVAGNYVSAPDSAALSITGDIDIRVQVALDDWTPASVSAALVGKYDISHESYLFFVNNTTGTLRFYCAVAGAVNQSAVSTVAPTVADGAALWVRVTRVAATGTVTFYTSNDGVAWTQLGATVATTAGNLLDSDRELDIGDTNSHTSNFLVGKVYHVQIRNNVLDDGTGIQFNAHFDSKVFGANSFVESSANAATVTINGGLAKAGDGRVSIESSTPGTQATLSGAAPQTVIADHVVIQDSNATGGAYWYATNSVKGSNVTGWGVGQIVTLGEATEADAGKAVVYARQVQLAEAVEADAGKVVTLSRTIKLGQAAEVDVAAAVSVGRVAKLSQATEADVAEAVGYARQVVLGRAAEADVAAPVTVGRVAKLAQATETDVAPVVRAQRAVRLDLAAEADVARAVLVARLMLLQEATEDDVAWDFLRAADWPTIHLQGSYDKQLVLAGQLADKVISLAGQLDDKEIVLQGRWS